MKVRCDEMDGSGRGGRRGSLGFSARFLGF